MSLLPNLRSCVRGGFVCMLATTSLLHPSAVLAQSFCGPVTLINFNGTNGQYPAAGVTFDGQGNMYGTTAQGGPSFNPIGNNGILNDGLGTIWKYSQTAGLTTLFSFSGATSPSNNGYRPLTQLVIDAQNNLYGTTYYGGNDFTPNINNHFGWGTVFQLSAAGQFTELYKFSGPDGANPVGMLIDSQANLWGTTWQGGADWNATLGNFGLGTLFERTASGTFSNPATFTMADGGNIDGGLTPDGLGNYYGTTYEGGSGGKGTIFRYSPGNGITTVFNFTGTNGMLPAATMTMDGQGNLYGTTYQGGAFSSPSNACCGTVWKYSTVTGTFTSLVSFDGDKVPADGMFPGGGVTLDSSGNLYGGTVMGGAFGDGIIYEYSSTGQLSTLVTFSGPNGWNPEGNLVFDASGNMYGATNQGGTSGYGTIFKLTPNPGGTTCGGVVLSSLTINPNTVASGSTTTGTVTLSAAAPSGGTVVGLSSDNSFALVPATVTVAAGATTGTFTITTKTGVLSNTAVNITASLGNSTVQASMTITPGSGSSGNLSSLALNPASLRGGDSSTGTVTLSAAAPSGGAVVTLASSNTSVATVPSSVTVQAGRTSASFSVRTQNVSSQTVVTISGTYAGATKSAALTVNRKN